MCSTEHGAGLAPQAELAWQFPIQGTDFVGESTFDDLIVGMIAGGGVRPLARSKAASTRGEWERAIFPLPMIAASRVVPRRDPSSLDGRRIFLFSEQVYDRMRLAQAFAPRGGARCPKSPNPGLSIIHRRSNPNGSEFGSRKGFNLVRKVVENRNLPAWISSRIRPAKACTLVTVVIMSPRM
jgi:hypothetical protein